MSGRRRSAALWLACAGCVVVLAGCYASDGPRDGSVDDTGMADGAPPFDGDAGMCDWLGSTRLCGPYCGLRCPEEVYACSSTSNDFHICENAGPDFEPRGQENCLIDLRFGTPYCYSGRLCVTSREPGPDGITWSGGCVSDEYCRWIQSQPGFERVSCRYTDGLVFEDGPPDDECAAGALPADPFCGGRCGDTCPANPYADFFGGPPSCVGRSETRGFGVCVQGSWDSRCWIGQEFRAETFANCGANLAAVGDPSGHPCVCMILSPVLMEEYADYGWAVAEQTCLAYQARYPDQVRCVPQSEL